MKRIINANIRPSGNPNYTSRLLDMINDDIISAESCLVELIQFLPQSTVEEFASSYFDDEDDEDDEDGEYYD